MPLELGIALWLLLLVFIGWLIYKDLAGLAVLFANLGFIAYIIVYYAIKWFGS